MRKSEIIDEINRISSKEEMDSKDVKDLAKYLNELKSTTTEFDDIFPALQEYKKEHNQANFQNLCVQAMEFCREIYSTTQNDDERNIYKSIFSKLPL